MRNEASKYDTPYQRLRLVVEVLQEAQKLTDAGYGNTRFAIEKTRERGQGNEV